MSFEFVELPFNEILFENVNIKAEPNPLLCTDDAGYMDTISKADFIKEEPISIEFEDLQFESIDYEEECPTSSESNFKIVNVTENVSFEDETNERHELNTSNQFECDECDKTYKNKYGLKFHKQTEHSGEKPFQCPICGTVIKFRNKVRAHLDSHPGDDGRYNCHKCNLSFETSTELKYHKREHFVRKDSYKCEECDKTYAHSSSLRNHKQAEHTLGKPFVCPICDAIIKYQSNVKVHMESHTPKPKVLLKCNQCPSIFRTMTRLISHRVKVHETVPKQDLVIKKVQLKSYHCNICEKSYAHRRSLQIHKVANHSDKQPYVCRICGQEIRYSNKIRAHLRSHGIERSMIDT